MASLGAVERSNRTAEGQIRTMRSATEERLKENLTIDHPIMTFMIRHAAWQVIRFHVQTDGKTPFERLKRKMYLGDVVEFAEMVYVKDPALKQDKLDDRWLGPLVWLGKTDKSDEHICVNAEGDELGFYRSIRRLPEDKRWDRDALKLALIHI